MSKFSVGDRVVPNDKDPYEWRYEAYAADRIATVEEVSQVNAETVWVHVRFDDSAPLGHASREGRTKRWLYLEEELDHLA